MASFEVPVTLPVELTLRADVTLTQEVLDGIKEQYPEYWEWAKDDPEDLAAGVLYALVNPRIPYRSSSEDCWDGVAWLGGLVNNAVLEGSDG